MRRHRELNQRVEENIWLCSSGRVFTVANNAVQAAAAKSKALEAGGFRTAWSRQ